MAEVKIMKAVEFDKCAAAFKKKHGIRFDKEEPDT